MAEGMSGGRATGGLGGPRGFGEVQLARGDDSSLRIDLRPVFETGLRMFGATHSADLVFVNLNGSVSLGAPRPEYNTGGPPPPGPFLAPFWGDVDTRLDGEGAESGTVWVDIDPGGGGPGRGIATITWDGVGVYRREAGTANTVQMQLVDRGGGDLDVVIRYQSIQWTRGSADDDAGARAGLSGPGGAGSWIVPGPGPDALLDLPDITGNTGTAGQWVYRFRGGVLDDLGGGGATASGTRGADRMTGGGFADRLDGLAGDDVLRGGEGADTMNGGQGRDTLDGGGGNDLLIGGLAPDDLRDVIYGGAGDDRLEGGHGNDDLNGQSGADALLGGFGSDTLRGHEDDDALSGGPLGDQLWGGPGDDFLNGGFGHDRMNGGDGADRFYHLGIRDHGSDWIQDYVAAQGDVLVFGGGARRDQFQVNWADTPRAGIDGFAEAFVVHRPTGLIVWALVDGASQGAILVEAGGEVFDLLA